MTTAAQIKSFHQTLQELGPRQREIIDLLMRVKGLSAWQIAEHTGRYVHAVRPRLTELRALGIVREFGEVWHKETQRHETVWALTPFEDDGQMRMAI